MIFILLTHVFVLWTQVFPLWDCTRICTGDLSLHSICWLFGRLSDQVRFVSVLMEALLLTMEWLWEQLVVATLASSYHWS